ncbi:MAG: phenylacetate--CoA ligase family protein [Candidatus Rokuibacteriota bacterium]
MNERLVRRVLLPLHERLKRKPTFERLREIEHTQWLAPDRLAEYRVARLRRLVGFAYDHVPYYRALLDEHGISPARVHSLTDIAPLPLLTREVLQGRFDDLRARAALPRVHPRSSGGSTGTPVTVLVDMNRMGMVEAGRHRAHGWFGIRPGARETILWGTPARLSRDELVRRVRDSLLNSMVLSAFDMGAEALGRHASALARFHPAKIYGYASACYLLAAHFQRRGLDPPRGLRAVFTTAEPLFDFQRKTIQDGFGCPVAVEYGCRDGGLVALECPEGGLHIFAESMHVEILDPDDDGRGEIVLTNLDSLAFPIIRYRTGDIGSLDPTPCRCGRSLPKLRGVEGRRTDFLVTPSGRVLHALSAIYILRESPLVHEFRIIQDAVEHLTVQIVPARAFERADEAALKAQFAAVFGSELKIDVDHLEHIPRTAAGKFRYVESRIAQTVIEQLMQRGTQGASTHEP